VKLSDIAVRTVAPNAVPVSPLTKREQGRLRAKRFRDRHPDRVLKWNRAWEARNKDKRAIYNSRRRKVQK